MHAQGMVTHAEGMVTCTVKICYELDEQFMFLVQCLSCTVINAHGKLGLPSVL